ncbi:MAG: serine hydrolase domain-containing protein [Pseudomonadota bacterium]
MTLCSALALQTGVARADTAAAIQSLERGMSALEAAPNMVALGACVASAEDVLLLRVQGQRRRSGDRIDLKTRFRLASLSKSFAATTALMLERSDLLDLATPIRQLVPYFTLPRAEDARRATLLHALSHRLGLPPNAYDNLLEAGRRPEVIVRRLEEVKPLCAAGDCYAYQNVGFNLIADAIEAATQVGFEEQVQHRVLTPLNMDDTGFGRPHLLRDDNWARPHRGRGSFLREVGVNENYYRVPAAAGMNASIRDLCVWLQAQLGGASEVLDDTLLARLTQPQVVTRAELYRGRWRRTRLRDAQYGLGWRIYNYAGHRVVFHAGSVSGYGALFALRPEDRVGLAAVWNSESTRPWGLAATFLDGLLGLPPEDWLKLEELSQEAP